MTSQYWPYVHISEILNLRPYVDSQGTAVSLWNGFYNERPALSRGQESRDFSAARYHAADRALHNLLGVLFAVAHCILKIRKILLAFISGWLTWIRGLHRLQREKLFSSTMHTAKTSGNEQLNLAQSVLLLFFHCSLIFYFFTFKFSSHVIRLFGGNVFSFLKQFSTYVLIFNWVFQKLNCLPDDQLSRHYSSIKISELTLNEIKNIFTGLK